MSLQLEKAGIDVKSHPWEILGGVVWVGEHEIPMDEFCAMVEYVFQNTDLRPNDPRWDTLARLKKLGMLDGYAPGRYRLG